MPVSPLPAAGSSGEAPPVQGPRTHFGRYRVVAPLGDGGMASVHLVMADGSAGFRKWLALKTLRTEHQGKERLSQMFFDECALTARLGHPNICHVFECGTDDGVPFLVMEYLHGQSLSAVLSRARNQGGLAPQLAARIASDAARGLHAAHELRLDDGALAGLVHRDVSPQNVFVLYDGVAKVVDFGIARWRERVTDETRTNELRGKLGYMAPEHLRHETVDRRTDVWALGVVLWECVVGRRLFRRESSGAVVQAILFDPIPAPRSLAPACPPAIESVILAALDRDPARRIPSAAAFADALDDALAEWGAAAGQGALAHQLAALFATEKRERESLLRTLPATAATAAATAKATAAATATPGAAVDTATVHSLSLPATSLSRAVVAPTRRARIAVGIALVCATVGLGLVARRAVRAPAATPRVSAPIERPALLAPPPAAPVLAPVPATPPPPAEPATAPLAHPTRPATRSPAVGSRSRMIRRYDEVN